MIEIDNKRMWESILRFKCEVKTEDVKNNPAGIAIKCIGDSIKHALNEQGLEYVNGEILSNRWFKCIHSFETAHDRFEEGKSYRYCDTVRRNMKYFRLDTEENASEADSGDMTDIEICLYDWLSNDSCGQIDKDTMRSVCKKRAEELTAIFNKEHQSELERAYKNQDEVVYQKGYTEGFDNCRKISIDALIGEIDVDEMVDYFTPAASESMLSIYRQGINNTLKRIKGE